MAEIQESEDTGIVSYGEPDQKTLAGISAAPSSSQNPAPSYKSVDDLLGGIQAPGASPQQPRQYNSVDDLLNEGQPAQSVSRFTGKPLPSWARSFQDYASTINKTLDAFVGGTYQAETQDLGFSEDTKSWLRKTGIESNVADDSRTFAQSLNDSLLNGLAATADAAMRLPVAPFEGLAAAAESSGNYGVARDIRIAPNLLMEHMRTEGFSKTPTLPKPVADARAAAVIGEGEAGFMGTRSPTAEQLLAREQATEQAVSLYQEQERLGLPPEAADLGFKEPPDVHAVAREIAPDTFREYDDLSEKRESYGNWIRDLSDKRREDAESSAPQNDEIEDLKEKVADAESRGKETVYSGILEKRLAEREEYIQQQISKLTPDIENTRQAYESADNRMRDLAPDVSAAYRQAQERMPHVETVEPPPVASSEEPQPIAPPPAPLEAAKTNLAAEALKPPPLPEQMVHISADVMRQMQEAGRPSEEAFAASKLIAEHYKARSERFNGNRGTPLEMYDRDAAAIKSGNNKALKGKFRPAKDEAKSTITLMKSANASTFMHETGHHWLDELVHDAEHEQAPSDLVKDAATVRKWLGAEVGDLTTRQHEKFARGFERYLMEGTAPNKTLAGVFSQFKQWLTDIYQTVSKLRSPITEDIRNVFDRLLTTKPERTVIAPERGDLFGNTASSEPVKSNLLENPPTPAAKKTPVLATVPRKPLTLMDWVKKNGGVKDEGGDLAAAFGKDAKGVIRKNGMSLDDMALKAHEEGYFDEKGSERPTINEFIDKLLQDRREGNQHSSHDQVAMDAYNDAIQRNAEAEKMAHELGIDMAGKTHDQFWNEVREKMSVEEQARQAQDIEAEHQSVFDESVKKVKEFLESRGEAWEAEGDNSRTLEDLENDHQQETASRKPGAGQSVAGQAEPSAGNPGRAQEVDGSGGGGVSVGPEPSAEPGPAGPREPIVPEKPKSDDPASVSGRPDPVIDRNGNPRYDLIEKRIEKINAPDDVDDFIRNAAGENDAFSEARRGIVSHAQTFALAEAAGVDGSFLDMQRLRKIGDAYNAHQLKGAEALFKTLSIDAYNKSLLEKTPENIAAFEAANQKFLMATSHFMAASSEAGRALNILRTMSEGVKQAKDIQEFFQRNTGKTAAEISKQMDFMSKLENPANQAAFIQASKKATFRAMMLEYYVNCLLSGPLTHLRYMMGNVVKAIETPLVEIPLAALHGAIRGDKERVYLGEAGAQLMALGQGSIDGLRAASTAWKTGQAPFLPGEIVRGFQPNAIPGKIGDFINIPSGVIEAIHAFSKTVRYTQNIAGLAYRTAMREGLEGDAFDRRVAEIKKAPSEAMMTMATKDALKELYMAPADYNSLSGTLVRVTNSNTLAKIIVPFMKIGTQITREAFVERTPLGAALSQDVRDNLMGRNGGAARDMQVGKILTGTALMSATATAVLSGNATGDGPIDPKVRAQWLLTHRPNTMTIGDLQIPYQGLGSLGMLMRFSANMTETAHAMTEEEGDKLGYSFLAGISKSILDDNWMRGLHDMLDSLYDEKKGERYIQNMATNWLPFSVGMGQIARAIDPFQREVRNHGMEDGFGLLDAIRSRIPLESENLLPRRDAFGQPIPNGANHNYENDPVVQRMDALRIYPSQLTRKIRGVQLTDQQYDDYSRIAGIAVKERLNQIVQQPGFDHIPPVAQIDMIKETIKLYREQARSAILMQYPDIMQKAMAAKRHDMTGQ